MKQKPDSRPTKRNAKPAESERVGTFEELLDLDPSKVKSIRVVRDKKTIN